MQRLIFISLVVCLFSVAACLTAEDKAVTSSTLLNGESVSLHAIYDARLRSLMREIDSLMFERMRTELEIDQERRQKTIQIGLLAQEMGQTVAYIIDSLPRLPLNENEKIAFVTLVNQLQKQVYVLKEQADRNYINFIPGTLEDITATCNKCHQLFREPVER